MIGRIRGNAALRLVIDFALFYAPSMETQVMGFSQPIAGLYFPLKIIDITEYRQNDSVSDSG